MKTKQLTYPTIEEQQQYWKDKEAQSDNDTRSLFWKHATNELPCQCNFPNINVAYPHECQTCMRLIGEMAEASIQTKTDNATNETRDILSVHSSRAVEQPEKVDSGSTPDAHRFLAGDFGPTTDSLCSHCGLSEEAQPHNLYQDRCGAYSEYGFGKDGKGCGLPKEHEGNHRDE